MVLMLTALSGCAKKQEVEELQPITLESLGVTNNSVQVVPDLETQEVNVPAVLVATAPAKELVPLPPQGPYRPTDIEIQTALSKAGFYTVILMVRLGQRVRRQLRIFRVQRA